MIKIDFDSAEFSDAQFEQLALATFRHQYQNVKVYQTYCKLLNISPANLVSLSQIPFLPIQFFKSHEVKPLAFADSFFLSSGTTDQIRSKRFVSEVSYYENSFVSHFESEFGPTEDLVILGLLPNYLEQGNSSLVYMVKHLIEKSNNPTSGFYLNNLDELSNTIIRLEADAKPYVLFGVSYALLDFAEIIEQPLKHAIIMETGGMKGKRKELSKHELHQTLRAGFQTTTIYSEYGMTELYSQAYSKDKGIFTCPPWMRVYPRDLRDPFGLAKPGKSAGLNIIDLANQDAVSFIETQDQCRVHENGSFEILGRIDNSEVRGCNLMLGG